MLYMIIIGVGSFLMLSLIAAIFIGAAIHMADIAEETLEDDDEY